MREMIEDLWPELVHKLPPQSAVIGILHPTSSDTKADRLRTLRKRLASWRQALSGTTAQYLNLEHELHHTASKACILGFEPLE